MRTLLHSPSPPQLNGTRRYFNLACNSSSPSARNFCFKLRKDFVSVCHYLSPHARPRSLLHKGKGLRSKRFSPYVEEMLRRMIASQMCIALQTPLCLSKTGRLQPHEHSTTSTRCKSDSAGKSIAWMRSTRQNLVGSVSIDRVRATDGIQCVLLIIHTLGIGNPCRHR